MAPAPKILRNSRNCPLHLLCFAVGNEAGAPTALRIANHLLKMVRQAVRDRARVFAIARGEACEAAAALDVAVLFGALTAEQAAPARVLLDRLTRMLSRLSRGA